MDVFRTADERFENLPGYAFSPHYLDVDGLADTTLRVHYVDEGSPHADPVVLFHGEPTWSFLYRKMIAPLVAAGHRVIAPDYLGFGRSDKPQSLDWYTYDRHVESMLRLIEALDLRGITAVVQDWGGPIGMRLATENPERFARLVILNTAIMSGENRMPEAWWNFRNFVDRVKPDIPIAMLVERACHTAPPAEVMRGYDAPFPEAAAKWGAAAFPLIVPTSTETPGAAAAIETARRLRDWRKPALVCFSDNDPIFSPRVGERLAERIPGALQPITVVRDAGHFLQEDKGEEIAEHVNRFLATAIEQAAPAS
jgi:haloalkane dehalogenase